MSFTGDVGSKVRAERSVKKLNTKQREDLKEYLANATSLQ